MYLFSESMKLKKLLPKNENLDIHLLSMDGTPLPSSFIFQVQDTEKSILCMFLSIALTSIRVGG